MKCVTLLVIFAVHQYINVAGTKEDSRRHYGLSFNNQCKNYYTVFKCMTACKSIGFQVFRVSRKCKCRCHEMKTSTILPFFKWRTNGTTRALPKTLSVKLYEVVGTLSPAPFTETEEVTSQNTTCPQWPGNSTTNATESSNATGSSNATESSNATGSSNATESSNTTSDPNDTTTSTSDVTTEVSGTDATASSDAETSAADEESSSVTTEEPTEAEKR